MLCKRCGTNNLDIARFCEHCGTNLVKGKYVSTKKEPEEKDVPTSLIVAVIIVILVVAGIFVTLSLV